jgi:hypothetical protein
LSCTPYDTSTNMTGARWWSAKLPIRFAVFGAVFAAVMSSAMAQSPVATYGYSRATLPGIPGDQKGTQGKDMFPPRYYLYLEVKPGSRISAEWAWVRGSYYNCTLTRVSTPVLVESDPGVPTEKKDTLVSKTSNDVYSVVLGDVKVRTASDGQERELIANNEAVIALVINKSSAYASFQSIKVLRPAAAM